MNDSADKPYKDYYCSNCGNRDTVNEEDNFCSICGSKFTTEDELCELAARLVIQDIAAEKKENELKEFLETIKSGKLPPLNLNSKRGIDYINKN